MVKIFLALVRRDLELIWKTGGNAFLSIVFYLTIVVIVPFGVGADHALLVKIAPAILWIGLLLASLLNLGAMFKDDLEDGSLDLTALSPLPLSGVVLAKCLGQWLAIELPLIIITPFFALLINLEPTTIAAVVLTMVVGSPGLVLIAAIGAAIATAFERGAILSATIIFPLVIPLLIFAVGAINGLGLGASFFVQPLLLLGSLDLVFVIITPIAAGAALRIALE